MQIIFITKISQSQLGTQRCNGNAFCRGLIWNLHTNQHLKVNVLMSGMCLTMNEYGMLNRLYAIDAYKRHYVKPR